MTSSRAREPDPSSVAGAATSAYGARDSRAGGGELGSFTHGTGEKAGESSAATSKVAVEAQPSSALISARK
jgi:hypothetical protein